MEAFLIETHHDTIEITPFGTQLGIHSERIWNRFIGKEVLEEGESVGISIQDNSTSRSDRREKGRQKR